MLTFQKILDELQSIISSGGSDEERATKVLAMSTYLRTILIRNTVYRDGVFIVQDGPFAGMNFPLMPADGCVMPKLLGSYEEELHPFFNRFAGTDYDLIIDIGCAEGYYAVGLARLFERARVLAYDIDANARQRCSELARLNGVTPA
jgi:2-polyprenyl-3-methyl-5-hydroxy-6-metoxy-1,4-benzoquinol methylase